MSAQILSCDEQIESLGQSCFSALQLAKSLSAPLLALASLLCSRLNLIRGDKRGEKSSIRSPLSARPEADRADRVGRPSATLSALSFDPRSHSRPQPQPQLHLAEEAAPNEANLRR